MKNENILNDINTHKMIDLVRFLENIAVNDEKVAHEFIKQLFICLQRDFSERLLNSIVELSKSYYWKKLNL